MKSKKQIPFVSVIFNFFGRHWFFLIVLGVFLGITIKNKSNLDKAASQSENPIASEVHNNARESLLLNKGVEYINQKKYEESIQITLEVLDINPNNKFAHNNIGFAYGNLGVWDKGIAYCKKAIELDENFQLAKNNLTWMQREQAKKDN